MEPRQIEAFYSLSLVVRRLFHKLGYGGAALHGTEEVSVGMRAVLESVIDGGPQTVPHMARVRPVTRQHIQGLVNALIAGGYVKYAENPGHKRSKLVRASRRGLGAFQRMRARENAAFARIAVDASPQELDAATRVLRALIATFESRDWKAVLEGYATDGGDLAARQTRAATGAGTRGDLPCHG